MRRPQEHHEPAPSCSSGVESAIQSFPSARTGDGCAHDDHGTWRSLVAHLTGGQGVVGSNPAVPTQKQQVMKGSTKWWALFCFPGAAVRVWSTPCRSVLPFS